MDKESIFQRFHDRFRTLGYGKSTETYTPAIGYDEMLGLVLKTAIDLIPSQSASLYVYNKRSRLLTLIASTTAKRQLNLSFSSAMGIVGRCYSRKTPLKLDQPGSNPLYEPKADGKNYENAENMLCIPLQLHNPAKAIGVLQMVNRSNSKDIPININTSTDKIDLKQLNGFQDLDVNTLLNYAEIIAVCIDVGFTNICVQETSTFEHQNSALDLLNMLNSKLTGKNQPITFIEDDPNLLDEPIKMPEPPKASGARKQSHRRSKQGFRRFPNKSNIITIRQIKAATTIQAGYRGWCVRRLHYLAVLRQERDANNLFKSSMAIEIQKLVRGHLARIYVAQLRHAYDLIARAAWQYIMRKYERQGNKMIISPKLKRTWEHTTTKLVSAKQRLKHRKIRSFRATHRIQTKSTFIKPHIAVLNPLRMHKLFTKIQVDNYYDMRKKIRQEQNTSRSLAIPSIVRLKVPQPQTCQSSIYNYPSTNHVGLNQYVSLQRGKLQSQALTPFFESYRIPHPPERLNHQPNQNSKPDTIELSSRRLISSCIRPATTPVPTRTASKLPYMKKHKALPKSSQNQFKPRYQFDICQLYGIKNNLPATTQPNYDLKDERWYPRYRKMAYEEALGVGVQYRSVPSTTKEKKSPFTACLVNDPKYMKIEATKQALREIPNFRRSTSNSLDQPAMDAIVEECRKLSKVSF
ncbi:hypothetical protein THRCLA_20702 [Thraustotheca clavata]|uniref:GAF domain-containing protein n=1 Tax=Thraustotheca clavata TaxID=74557 RepID=A0A1W0A4I9_9STRA|nr:hypothetical protein THRCLA_20702 [Thraustotheca clavata]